jgi:hypothetical protein
MVEEPAEHPQAARAEPAGEIARFAGKLEEALSAKA